jgi:hypothetical protein
MFHDIHSVDSTKFRPDCLQEPKESRDRFNKKRRKPMGNEAGSSKKVWEDSDQNILPEGDSHLLDIEA